ncbi:MAG: hypothetical protein OEQ74_02720 [Gammaproteobacteria bacterium]|nr:hypothetical protein [Gammaproteobacteria bacterium]
MTKVVNANLIELKNAALRNQRRCRTLLVCALVVVFNGCSSAAAPKTLGINIRGSVSVTPTTFSGYYIFEDMQGSEVRRNIQGSGNFNDVMQGKRVLLVTVRRTSTQGVIGLVVTSDSEIIYDSGMLQTNELIVFESP